MLHTVFNRSNNDDGVVAGLVPGEARGLAGLLALIVLTAAVAAIARRRPGRSHRRTPDGSEGSAPDQTEPAALP